jgi:hypothetical protein
MADDLAAIEEVVLQENPRIIDVPTRLLSRAEWLELIVKAASLVVESLDAADAKKAEFSKGMSQLAEICMSSFIAPNGSTVLPHPQITPAIEITLLTMFPQLCATALLDLPANFHDLDRFIATLTNRKMYIMGNFKDEEILLTLSGDVPMGLANGRGI